MKTSRDDFGNISEQYRQLEVAEGRSSKRRAIGDEVPQVAPVAVAAPGAAGLFGQPVSAQQLAYFSSIRDLDFLEKGIEGLDDEFNRWVNTL